MAASDGLLNRVRARKIESAHRYAAFDKSDPFALARALTHIRNGRITAGRPDGEPSDYDAEPFQEMRKLPDGTEYAATVFRNAVRP